MSAAGRAPRSGDDPALDHFATPRAAFDAIAPHILAAIAPRTLADVTILDPSCGRGNLLKAAVEHGADPSRCYGVEIDPWRASVCAKFLPPGHIVCADYLAMEYVAGAFKGGGLVGHPPDLVVKNPPFLDGEAHLRRSLAVVAPGGIVCALNRTAFYLESAERAAFRAEHPCDLYPMSFRLSFTAEILEWATEADLLAMRRTKLSAQMTLNGGHVETLDEVRRRLKGCDNAPHAWALFGPGRGGRYQVLERPR